MAGRDRFGGFAAAVFAAVVLCLGGCGRPAPEPPQTVCGVVDLETLVKAHPSYGEYFRLQKEYEDLLARYQAEKKRLFHLSETQRKIQAALTSQNAAKAAEEEYKARVKIKEIELNDKLQQLYGEIQKGHDAAARPEMAGGGGEDNTQIANLHLKLKFLNIDQGEKARAKEELKDLLNGRYAEIPQEGWTEEEKKRFMEERSAAKAELDAYAGQVAREIHERQQKSQAAAMNVQLPDADTWNSQWEARVRDNQKEMADVKAKIMDDIRDRATIVGEKKHLDIIFSSYRANVNAEDVTSDIVNELVQIK